MIAKDCHYHNNNYCHTTYEISFKCMSILLQFYLLEVEVVSSTFAGFTWDTEGGTYPDWLLCNWCPNQDEDVSLVHTEDVALVEVPIISLKGINNIILYTTCFTLFYNTTQQSRQTCTYQVNWPIQESYKEFPVYWIPLIHEVKTMATTLLKIGYCLSGYSDVCLNLSPQGMWPSIEECIRDILPKKKFFALDNPLRSVLARLL